MSKRCTAFDSRYNISQKTMTALKGLDPTLDKCIYVDYILRQYSEGKLIEDNFNTFKYYLRLFDDNKSHIKNKDINTYDLDSLKQLFSVSLKDNIQGDVNVLYDGPYGNLSIPLSHKASCKLGSGTKWCTASNDEEDSYQRYTKDGPLYVWYDKNWNKGELRQLGNTSKKFQFHFETVTYMDETDNSLNDKLLYYFVTEHPVISILVDRYEDSIEDDDMKLVKFAYSLDPTDDIGFMTRHILNNALREELLIKYIIDDELDIKYPYMDDIYKRHINNRKLIPYIASLDPDYLKYISNDVELMYEYATIVRKPVKDKDMERKILSNPKYTLNYLYIMHDLRRPDNIDSDNIIIRALVNREKYLDINEINKIDHRAALYYATHVIRSRCRSIETEDIDKIDYLYYSLFIKPYTNKLEYGKEEEYMKNNIFDINEYMKYYKKHGRSNIIDKYLIDKEDYHNLTILALYCYNAPMSYCYSHLDSNIESKAINNNNIWYKEYMYVFYGKGKPINTECILRRMIIHGETKELYDELSTINQFVLMENTYSSLSEISIRGLRYILSKTTWLFTSTLCSVYIGERNKNLEVHMNKLLESSSFQEKIAYQLYWNKFLEGIEVPKLENTYFNYIYLDNYKGKIDKYENMAIIPEKYLKTRVKI